MECREKQNDFIFVTFFSGNVLTGSPSMMVKKKSLPLLGTETELSTS
jgi:hypothetical protein